MEITLNIDYTEQVIPPRCRKSRPQKFDGIFKVKIKEVAEEEAPIAFKVHQACSPDTIVRCYKGKLYREAHEFVLDENRDRKYLTLEETRWDHLLKPYGVKTLVEVQQAIKIASKNYLIIGNTLYVVTGEPYYYFVCFGLGHNHGGMGFFVEFADISRTTIRGYAANDYETAIADTKTVAIRRGDTESMDYLERSGNGHIEVIMPECIKRKYQPQLKK